MAISTKVSRAITAFRRAVAKEAMMGADDPDSWIETVKETKVAHKNLIKAINDRQDTIWDLAVEVGKKEGYKNGYNAGYRESAQIEPSRVD